MGREDVVLEDLEDEELEVRRRNTKKDDNEFLDLGLL